MALEKLKPQTGQRSVKRMFQRTLIVLFAITTSMMISTASFASCGSLTMAEMNWASAELMAHVDKIILEEGYGCDVELVAGATMPTFTSMNEKGEPDVAAEQ